MEQRAYLFVYGTLRADPPEDHPFLNKYGSFYGRGEFQGRLYDIGGFPGAVASKARDEQVVGDLYAVEAPEVLFPYLDKYEGCGGLAGMFERCLAPITTTHGVEVESWIYLFTRRTRGHPVIMSGDYMKHLHLSERCLP